jgi:ELWxxDGT repeat protein
LVKDIGPGPTTGFSFFLIEQDLADSGAGLLFAASDGIHGVELWKSDGSTTGTFPLQEIAAGPGSAAPRNFTVVRQDIFFSADDNSAGRELWVVPTWAQRLPRPAAERLADRLRQASRQRRDGAARGGAWRSTDFDMFEREFLPDMHSEPLDLEWLMQFWAEIGPEARP